MIRTKLLMLAAILLAARVHAAEPPITLLQGFGPGGNSDTIARIVAQGLGKELGRTVVVDAKTGAGGNIASATAAKAKPDGNTLILMTGGHAVSAAVYRTLPFHPVDDFEWLTTVTRFPFVIATSSQSPYQSLPDVLAAARAAPGQLSFSSVGIGSTQHLAGELFQSMAGVRLNHIPYRGGGAPVQDVIAGRVDLLFDSVTVARTQVEGGRLRALGVTSPGATPLLPGVPPVSKSVPGFEVISWTAVAAPRGLAPEVSEHLRGALAKVLRSPDVVRQLEGTGGEVAASADGAATRAFVESQVAKWKRVVNDARIEQQ
ncbi:tripartite tricarboxylate transporter substrate-binding protein [Variovorax sp. J31P179]|uniref:tripartite tricarboxylate transporter substrate-binding protein n=1 Tax=Variovorax sp. J31P179 TaxID=3053508 RepID=UPI0025787B0E|nr:tripartite tricarboxylate transporter substrate-binding protein [Variovorax sp. J31P179]MDM0085416.1 tripartite tricarboxylate transporter substrate-binding protein [Variovorax sp. J31P179]